MRYATPQLRRAATQLLAREPAAEPAMSEDVAATAARLLDTLSQRLGEVIGPAGVQAILLRAVKLLQPEFAFLDERIVSGERDAKPIETLRERLREQEPDAIREATVMLFATILGLLAAVIGERLAWSLLQQIWPDTLPSEAELQGAQE